ncbi:MAG: crossover junction endodeoxyribonuclease RuvC [Acidobacteria bacterium]|nr:crossover junction endodeoxyribonuclease RuvC [Acidobacteriota bacterium]
MIVMGVDPGSRCTGFGVVLAEANKYRCLDYGSVAGVEGDALPQRLRHIYSRLEDLFKLHQPAAVVVEELFYAVNARSALVLGQTRGVILLAAAQAGIPLYQYSALEIKKAVSGYGRAGKGQIQSMVSKLLGLRNHPQPHDAADALAAALCHLFRHSCTRYSLDRFDGGGRIV